MTIFLLSIAGIALVLTIAIAIEGWKKTVPLNAAAGLVQLVFTQVFTSALTPGVLWVAGKLGKPPIHLPGGWWFPVSLFVMLAVSDLIDYAFHRLEHGLPWLWAMHSLHHSDSSMNATTAWRHFWLDRALHAAAYIPLGLLVRAPGGVIAGLIAGNWVIAAFEHSSLHLGLKPAWLVVTPQFHRVHHSIRQEHYDRNFAGFLPLWDVIFGTYVKPEGYPETGLTEGEPRGVKDALLWAFQKR